MTKTIIVYCPIFEFHAFGKCNVFIHELKKCSKTELKVVCAIPENAIGVLPEADELLVTSMKYLSENNIGFPEILNYMQCNTPSYGEASRDGGSHRQQDTLNFIKNYYKDTEYEIIFYGENSIQNIRGETIYDWYTAKDLTTSFIRDFNNICKYVRNNNYYKPNIETYNRIKEQYSKLFNNNTFILLTRYFEKKQPETNSLVMNPNLTNFVNFIVEHELKIVNIGFPAQPLNISNKNYIELSEKLTQDELMSIFYLSNGIILSGENGAFSIHACSFNNIYMINREWSTIFGKPLEDASILYNRSIYNANLESININERLITKNYSEIYNILINSKSTPKLFSNSQKTIYIK